MKRGTWRGGVVVSNNKASGLSARTEDFVHKQLNPHRHEYKLSKLSGIQVHPFTKTLTWFIFNLLQPESPSMTCNEDDGKDPFEIKLLCFFLNWAQPTSESHFLKAPIKSVNGSGVYVIECLGSVIEGIEEETVGNSRKPEKQRTTRVKPSISAMANEFRGFNCMVRISLVRSTLPLSPSQKREKGRTANWLNPVLLFSPSWICSFSKRKK